MNTLIIRGGTCVTPEVVIDPGVVTVHDGVIISVDAMGTAEIPSGSEVIDASGLYVCPGFIDIQVNGAAGFDVLDATEEALVTIARFNISHGTTSFLPTLVSSSMEKMTAVFDLARNLRGKNHAGSKIIGLHIEGPYISKTQVGAHDPRYVRVPVREEVDILSEYSDVVRIITAAPEVPGVLEACRELIRGGMVASIGHSNATYDQVLSAVDSGFAMVTHIYSVMSSMTRIGARKVAGVLEAALLSDRLSVEVIGDGFHVPEPFLRLVLRMKGTDKIVLVTDAIRATGLPDGKYTLGTDEDDHVVLVENGVAMTPDRALYAGSTTTMDECIRNTMTQGDVNFKDAIAMATINPAGLLHVDHEIGSLEPGKKGDIVILDQELKPVFTIVNGEIAFRQENVFGPRLTTSKRQ